MGREVGRHSETDYHIFSFGLFIFLGGLTKKNNIAITPYFSFSKLLCSATLYCRCEIEATLERLKKLERDLSTKEQELKEREQRLKMWERKLIEQSSSPVSSSLFPLHLGTPSPSVQATPSVKSSLC